MSLGENTLTETQSIVFDTTVKAGIMVDFSGTPGNTAPYGVTMHDVQSGDLGLVARSGPCQIQAANATVAKGSEIEINADGRAIVLAAGDAVGMADENGVAAVSGVYKLVGIMLYQRKNIPPPA